jgi:hypothetical protein
LDSPLRGTIFINEVASTPTPFYKYCPNNDWIELINTGNVSVDFTGLVLHDDRGPTNNESFTFPLVEFVIPPGLVFAICRDESDDFSFLFDIDSNDTITLLDSNGDFISTTGVLPNGGGETLTYQRTANNTYMYGFPTPDSENFPNFIGSIFINEVASSPTPKYAYCYDNDWIELINVGDKGVDLAGFVLHDDRGPFSNDVFTFLTDSFISHDEVIVICGQPFNSTSPNSNAFTFDIDGNDTITLLDFNGNVLSTTGVLPNGGNATSTYQRTTNNTYIYGSPTPRFENLPIVNGSIFINEVANGPTIIDEDCRGNDWIELINVGNIAVYLTGYVLHDDRGPTNNESFIFPSNYEIYPGRNIICGQSSDSPEIYEYNFIFDIDRNDTITLRDNNGNVISTTGVLPNGGNATSTYQRTTNNTYMYGFPTPHQKNFRTFTGSILINEVANSATPSYGKCSRNEWIELINAGTTNVQIDGFILHDDKGLFLHDDQGLINPELYILLPRFLSPGDIYVICGGQESFRFDIDSNDTITLLDFNGNVISTTGMLTNGGGATSTYQRTRNNTYMYGSPSPKQDNFAVFVGSILINEVASSPTPDYGYCYDSDWIELINAGNTNVNLTGFILHDDQGPSNNESFTFVDELIMYPADITIICGQNSVYSNYFQFDIDGNDTITLLDSNRVVLSTTGVLQNKGNESSSYQRIMGTNNTYVYGLPTPLTRNVVTAQVPVPVPLPIPVPVSNPIGTEKYT